MISSLRGHKLNRRTIRSLLVFTGCVAAIAIQGCIPAPQTAKHAGLSGTTRASSTGPTTGPVSAELWKAEVFTPNNALSLPPSSPPRSPPGSQPSSPPRSPSGNFTVPLKRIAITEFALEFVTVRTQTPFASQLAVKIPPWDPIGLALELVGISRAETPFEPTARIELTATLFNEFVAHLQQLNYAVLPQTQIHETAGYEALTKGHADGESADSSALDYFRLLSTDIGVINASTAQPAPHTRLADKGQSAEDRRKAEVLVLQQSGADATLSVHLLVGCYQGRAAIEQGSRVRVMQANGQEITMTSQRSLLSNEKVRAPGYFMPVVGMVQPVKQDIFDHEISELINPYLRPALKPLLGNE